MKKSRILVIEDNQDTRKFLTHVLSKKFEILESENAILGIEIARNQKPDLILLDIMLPHLNGLDACKMFKNDERTREIPIIFLTAKSSVNDITEGLNLGADDYVAKPFDYKVLVARIEARLRSSQSQTNKLDNIVVGDLKINLKDRQVFFKNVEYELTLSEYDILRMLASAPGETVTRKDILDVIRHNDKKQINDRTIDVHVRSIRKKIPDITRYLTSVYGVGYKWEL